MKKVGIITCCRFDTCTGVKCFRPMGNWGGAFAFYRNEEAKLVGARSVRLDGPTVASGV
jgi:hypothetical protein